MSKAATLAAAQEVNAAITGMTTAPTAYPASLPNSELPCAFVYVGPGTVNWEAHSADFIKDSWTLIVDVYVTPLGQGEGINEGMQRAIALLDAFLATWRTTDELSNGAEVDVTAVGTRVVGQGIRHSGIRNNMQYSEENTYYRGFRAEIPVYERIEDDV